MTSIGGEDSQVPPAMDFHVAVGSSESGSRTTGGSRIMKINGCLERCSERLKLVIPPELIAEDIEYFSKHSLYCKFLGMRVSL